MGGGGGGGGGSGGAGGQGRYPLGVSLHSLNAIWKTLTSVRHFPFALLKEKATE